MKAAIIERAESHAAPSSLELTAVIREIAADVRRRVLEGKTWPASDGSLILGIAVVGLMTLQQVGLAAFRAGSGTLQVPQGVLAKTPEQIVAARKKNDSQGLAGIFSRHPRAVHSDVRRASKRCMLHRHQSAASDDGVGQR